MLRDYQNSCINSLRQSILNGNKRIILCSPTGSGKTMMFSFMVSEAIKRGGNALVLTDRIELLKQAGGSFSRFNLQPELIQAGKEPDLTLPLHVAMIETLSRRADRYRNYIASRKLIIIDEAHKTAFEKIFHFISESCVVIGATATPFRSGTQSSLDEFYTDIIQEVDTPDLVQQGFLSDAKTYGVDIDLKGIKKKGGDYDTEQMGKVFGERKVYEGVIENYNRLTPNTKALLFAPNISSSIEVCAKLKSAGLPALHLDSEMAKHERESILSAFSINKNIILCNVGILTTGFDCPDIETVILYRATTSLPLFLQMVGRGSRTTPNKSSFNILDFGNNIKTHDFWEAPRTWSLQKKKRNIGVPPVKNCPKCGAMVPASRMICGTPLPPEMIPCLHEWKLSEKEIKEKEFAELKLLPKPDLFRYAAKQDIKKKAEMAKAKLISPMAVLHGLTDIEEARSFIKEMNYKSGFEYANKERFKVFKKEYEKI